MAALPSCTVLGAAGSVCAGDKRPSSGSASRTAANDAVTVPCLVACSTEAETDSASVASVGGEGELLTGANGSESVATDGEAGVGKESESEDGFAGRRMSGSTAAATGGASMGVSVTDTDSGVCGIGSGDAREVGVAGRAGVCRLMTAIDIGDGAAADKGDANSTTVDTEVAGDTDTGDASIGATTGATGMDGSMTESDHTCLAPAIDKGECGIGSGGAEGVGLTLGATDNGESAMSEGGHVPPLSLVFGLGITRIGVFALPGLANRDDTLFGISVSFE